MARLRFLGKVAFLCNLFFVAAFILRYKLYSTQVDLNSHIILLGWLLSPFFNICFLFVWYFERKKRNEGEVPAWLTIANSLFLFVQILSFFILR